MIKKNYFFSMLAAAAVMTAASCSSSDDNGSNQTPSAVNEFGIYTDENAGEAPVVDESASTVTISNISAPVVEANSNGMVGNITFTGIKAMDGDFMKLSGTGTGEAQNIWMSIDGRAKSIAVINSDDDLKAAKAKGMADIVFLIDNSGSMSEEANVIAKEILEWSDSLSKYVDCRFGCVGYGDNSYGVDGGMNIDSVGALNAFLNRSGYYGTSRSQGFYGYDKDNLQAKALSNSNGYYNGSYNECGGLALHFADELFKFREGANRIYLNFTDEPNQPANYKQWSVETLNPNDTLYNWNSSKGTIHTVYSGRDTASYKAPDGYYYKTNLSSPFGWYEKPWAMSEYTGGLMLFADPYFTNVTLKGLEVTAAISSTYVMRFNITDDLREGLHNIILTIKDKKGNQAVKEFKNVTFALPK